MLTKRKKYEKGLQSGQKIPEKGENVAGPYEKKRPRKKRKEITGEILQLKKSRTPIQFSERNRHQNHLQDPGKKKKG